MVRSSRSGRASCVSSSVIGSGSGLPRAVLPVFARRYFFGSECSNSSVTPRAFALSM